MGILDMKEEIESLFDFCNTYWIKQFENSFVKIASIFLGFN